MAGKCQKAREGKIVADRKPNYGFSFTADKNSLLIHEEQMAVVRRIFEMVGPEAKTINATGLALSREGVPTASGARAWSAQSVRAYLLDDAYNSTLTRRSESWSRPTSCAASTISASTACGGSTGGNTRRTVEPAKRSASGARGVSG